jgi:UDP-2-acetamido-2-deoxy-ribo-hexuluronate aminotransferase
VVLAKLGRLDWELQRRREIGARYHARLAALDLTTLAVRPDRDSVWGQYTVRVKNRAEVQAKLTAAGVPTAVHYPKPLHRQPAYERFAAADGCPVALAAADEVMSLPMSADLSDADFERVVAALADAVGPRKA